MSGPFTTALGIDAGGSGTRWRALDADGAVRGEGVVAPFSGHLFDEARFADARTALSALRQELEATGIVPSCVVAGVTGLSSDAAEADLCASLVADALGLAPAQVSVCSDLVLAYRSAFAPDAGVVVYAGTGSAACHLRSDGCLQRVGGHGHILDDAGSAYWIGREAVREVVRLLERRPDIAQTPFTEVLAESMGGLTWPDVRRYTYEAPRPHLAALARCVATAAGQGDPTALRILAAAGRELAALALRMIDFVGAKPIAVTGRVASLDPIITESMARALPNNAEPIAVVDTPPVVTAAAMAWEGQSPR